MQTFARVVVIGGGNMGTGILYHLAKEGWTDIALTSAERSRSLIWHQTLSRRFSTVAIRWN
jgi:dimethylglycine dehydrogenase